MTKTQPEVTFYLYNILYRTGFTYYAKTRETASEIPDTPGRTGLFQNYTNHYRYKLLQHWSKGILQHQYLPKGVKDGNST